MFSILFLTLPHFFFGVGGGGGREREEEEEEEEQKAEMDANVRKKEKPPSNSAVKSFFSIFMHADSVDKAFMTFGILGAIGDGLSTPIMLYISSKILNDLGGGTGAASLSEFTHKVNEVAMNPQFFFFFFVFQKESGGGFDVVIVFVFYSFFFSFSECTESRVLGNGNVGVSFSR